MGAAPGEAAGEEGSGTVLRVLTAVAALCVCVYELL